HVYDFAQNHVPGAGVRDGSYWRGLATPGGYFHAHMDPCAGHPVVNLLNHQWPLLTHGPAHPPAKIVPDPAHPVGRPANTAGGHRVGRAINSVVGNGVIISGGLVRNSVLSPGARVDSWSRVDRSVILDNSRVSRRAVVQHAILDKNVTVLEGATVGVDKEHDR